MSYKKQQPRLFILDNKKWKNFCLKEDNGKLWVELIIVTFLVAVVTVDVLTTSSNDLLNLSEFELYILQD